MPRIIVRKRSYPNPTRSASGAAPHLPENRLMSSPGKMHSLSGDSIFSLRNFHPFDGCRWNAESSKMALRFRR